MSKKVSILILEYNRPKELEICLSHLDQFANFDKKIYLLSNGSHKISPQILNQVDTFIYNKANNGCGFGTMQLFDICDTEFAIYHQVDQAIGKEISQEKMDEWIQILKVRNNPKIGHIDLAGNQNRGSFSERAALFHVPFYRNIPKVGGGPGPFSHLLWNEEACGNFYKEHNIEFISENYILDLGKWSQRTNRDGSEWLQRTDTKELYLLKGPVKEKYHFPFDLTDEEWDIILKGGWKNGDIVEQQKQHSFRVPFWDTILPIEDYIK